MGFHAHSPYSVLGFLSNLRLHRSSIVGLSFAATVPVSSYVHIPCCIRRTVLSKLSTSVSHNLLLFYSYP
jgi:transcriptional regulatory protein LevR